jgi:hypothetical protein
MAHITILSKVAYYVNNITKYKTSANKTRFNAGRLGEKSQYQINDNQELTARHQD